MNTFWRVGLLSATGFLRQCVRRHFLVIISWWCHQMETFSELLALCAGNSPVTGRFPSQRPMTRSFDVVFDLRLNKRLSKQSWGWWFETLSRALWRHRNALYISFYVMNNVAFQWYIRLCSISHLPWFHVNNRNQPFMCANISQQMLQLLFSGRHNVLVNQQSWYSTYMIRIFPAQH